MKTPSLPTVCAWCRRVRSSQGEWSEPDLPELDGRIATHGICPTCLEKATARATIAPTVSQ